MVRKKILFFFKGRDKNYRKINSKSIKYCFIYMYLLKKFILIKRGRKNDPVIHPDIIIDAQEENVIRKNIYLCHTS